MSMVDIMCIVCVCVGVGGLDAHILRADGSSNQCVCVSAKI